MLLGLEAHWAVRSVLEGRLSFSSPLLSGSHSRQTQISVSRYQAIVFSTTVVSTDGLSINRQGPLLKDQGETKRHALLGSASFLYITRRPVNATPASKNPLF